MVFSHLSHQWEKGYIILLDLLVVYLAIIKLSHNPYISLPIPNGATLILIGTIQSPV
jgi:Na+-transporting methylmalonyl-CoA/oxaloacetate decarboxylase beta subunit